MSQTLRIESSQLRALQLHQGDTLRVLSEDETGALVLINRSNVEKAAIGNGKVDEWLRTAKGRVQLAPGESIDDVRAAYYAKKYERR